MNPRVRQCVLFMETVSSLSNFKLTSESYKLAATRVREATDCFNTAASAASKFRDAVNAWAEKEQAVFQIKTKSLFVSLQDACFNFGSLENYLEEGLLFEPEVTISDVEDFCKRITLLVGMLPQLVSNYK
eukprot:Platyproteum_vivax@DN8045_c0_g1_i1.p1